MIDTATSADVLASLIAKLPDGPLKERAKARRAEVLNETDDREFDDEYAETRLHEFANERRNPYRAS